jgi:hypothetical protein
MRTLVTLLLVLALPVVAVRAVSADKAQASRFATVGIVLNTHGTPLAAYQLAFSATAGDVTIVGIEGGEHPAFSEPPYYDPQAIQQERVILAAFNTADADELPTGKTRVATIHLEIRGETPPKYAIDLAVAADTNGKRIDQAEAETQEPAS